MTSRHARSALASFAASTLLTIAGATMVSAGFGDLGPEVQRFDPPPVETAPCKVRYPVRNCWLPDFTAFVDRIGSSYHGDWNGRKATFEWIEIKNRGGADGGPLWISVTTADVPIEDIVFSFSTDPAVTVESERAAGPTVAKSSDGDAWVVRVPEGLAAGETLTVKVIIDGWVDQDFGLAAHADYHVGVEELGARSIGGYQHGEWTEANNAHRTGNGW